MIIRPTASRVIDILSILYLHPHGMLIADIWRESSDPPKYDVSIRGCLQKLWDNGIVERIPPEIKRGRAHIIWKMTSDGIALWEKTIVSRPQIDEGGHSNGTDSINRESEAISAVTSA